jgi:hypothetical protein
MHGSNRGTQRRGGNGHLLRAKDDLQRGLAVYLSINVGDTHEVGLLELALCHVPVGIRVEKVGILMQSNDDSINALFLRLPV